MFLFIISLIYFSRPEGLLVIICLINKKNCSNVNRLVVIHRKLHIQFSYEKLNSKCWQYKRQKLYVKPPLSTVLPYFPRIPYLIIITCVFLCSYICVVRKYTIVLFV